MKTRGVRKDSQEYDQIRNQIYAKLRDEKNESKKQAKNKNGGSIAVEKEYIVNFDRVYTLLIVVPEEVESHLCVNVLSFFGFPMNVEEDNLQNMIIKKEMGF